MSGEKNVVLWTPGMADHSGSPSTNLGDQIIERYVVGELEQIFGVPSQDIPRMSTHQRLTPKVRDTAKAAKELIIGGSNLLSSYMDGYFQWDLIMSDALRVPGAILMGAGWWRDQGTCNRYTKYLLWAALSWGRWHSVRDSQALSQLKSAGFRKVLNTGCPTMWSLAEKDMSAIPTDKAANALVMLTDYDRDKNADGELLDLLKKNYRKVYFWPQGTHDREYALSLGFSGEIIDRSLTAFDELVESSEELDYIGTRLHGGIRCLHAGRRCLTIEVDNRAREIGSDTRLPTVPRGDLKFVENWIQSSSKIQLALPLDNIKKWKSQFGSN